MIVQLDGLFVLQKYSYFGFMGKLFTIYSIFKIKILQVGDLLYNISL